MSDDAFDRVHDRSAGNAEKYALRRALFGTDDVLPMWVADMDIETPSCVTEAVLERAGHGVYGYEEMPQSAFEAQIGWLARRHGLRVEREWMFYSPSVVASINLCIQAFTEPGEGVIVQPPVYFPFFDCVRSNGRRLVRNPLRLDAEGVYRFDFDQLERVADARTKLLLLCSPHNPVGRVWDASELRRLADFCLERGIRVVADEIHSDLIFEGACHTPFASLGDDVRAITATASGPGKTFNMAGLGISTLIVGDAAMRERLNAVYERTHFGQGTIFSHVAFEAAFTRGDAWLEALMRHLAGNVMRLEQTLGPYLDTIRFRRPEGTYLAWLDCRGGAWSDRALRRFFIEEAKLGLSPGTVFGKEGTGHMRLNFAVPSPVMDEALRRLGEALSRL